MGLFALGEFCLISVPPEGKKTINQGYFYCTIIKRANSEMIKKMLKIMLIVIVIIMIINVIYLAI